MQSRLKNKIRAHRKEVSGLTELQKGVKNKNSIRMLEKQKLSYTSSEASGLLNKTLATSLRRWIREAEAKKINGCSPKNHPNCTLNSSATDVVTDSRN